MDFVQILNHLLLLLKFFPEGLFSKTFQKLFSMVASGEHTVQFFGKYKQEC